MVGNIESSIRDLVPDDVADRIRSQFDDLRDRVIRSLPRERARRERRTRALLFAGAFTAGAAAGAVIAYLFDPRAGRGRRSRISDQAAAVGRDTVGTAERLGRKVASDVEGKMQAAREGTDDYVPPNAVTLARKVESEILGDPEIPKDSIVVNAEGRSVILRGEVPSDRVREKVDRLVGDLPGVEEVVSLLHLPGEPAPNKEAVRSAGR